MRSRKKDPKDLKRHPTLPPSTRNALFYTFIGIRYPDDIPPPYYPPKKKPPITDFLFEWTLPPSVNRFNQTIFRYHRLWADAVNELEHGFSNEPYEPSFVEGYFWSPMEKRRFFAALDKCGPHDPAAIQQRIGPTKTVYQVQLYLSLLQEASEEHPIPEGMTSTLDSNNIPPFAYEMSPAWIDFEEQQAHYLSIILDNEAMSLDYYHRSLNKVPPPPGLAIAQQALEQELYAAQEIIDPSPLYEWAARNPVDGMAPPTMTLESQTVLSRLVREFVAEVMTGVILNHRRQRHRRRNKITKDDPTNSEMTDDLDIGESEIEAALRDYGDNDGDTDMDMDLDINQEVDDLDADSDLDDDGQGLGFVVGYDSDTDSSDTDTDTDADADTDTDGEADASIDVDTDSEDDDDGDDDFGGAEMDADSDGFMYEASSSDNDSDGKGDNRVVPMEQGLDDEIRMQQEDRAYEQGLYHHIIF